MNYTTPTGTELVYQPTTALKAAQQQSELITLTRYVYT